MNQITKKEWDQLNYQEKELFKKSIGKRLKENEKPNYGNILVFLGKKTNFKILEESNGNSFMESHYSKEILWEKVLSYFEAQSNH